MSVTGGARCRSPASAGLAGAARTGAGSRDRGPPGHPARNRVIPDPNARLAVLELATMTDPATFVTRDGTTALADRTGVIPDSCVLHRSTLDPSIHDAPHATGRMTAIVQSAYDRGNARRRDGRHRSNGTYVPPSLAGGPAAIRSNERAYSSRQTTAPWRRTDGAHGVQGTPAPPRRGHLPPDSQWRTA